MFQRIELLAKYFWAYVFIKWVDFYGCSSLFQCYGKVCIASQFVFKKLKPKLLSMCRYCISIVPLVSDNSKMQGGQPSPGLMQGGQPAPGLMNPFLCYDREHLPSDEKAGLHHGLCFVPWTILGKC